MVWWLYVCVCVCVCLVELTICRVEDKSLHVLLNKVVQVCVNSTFIVEGNETQRSSVSKCVQVQEWIESFILC